MTPLLQLASHPLLAVEAFATTFPRPLEACPAPGELMALLRLDAPVPLKSDDPLRAKVRDLLRHGGYKPTGRGKPASEYLIRAATEGALGTINLAVDACNAVSLHSGLPISVVDLERATPPFRIAVAAQGERYVFNSSGQEIDLSGLLCLFDAAGPAANAVKDSQRTKTHGGTTRTLSVIWGARGLEDQLSRATAWYRSLLENAGATTEPWPQAREP